MALSWTLDEFTYAHSAWLISQGERPYRDFALLHPPLVELLFAPVFWVTEHSLEALLIIRVTLALLLVLCIGSLERLNLRYAPFGVTAMIALGCGIFPSWMLEIRPDSVAVILTIFAIVVLEQGRTLLSASLVALALFSSEKVLIYGAALPLALLVSKRETKEFYRFVFCGAVVATILFGLQILWVGWLPTKLFYIDWTVAHELAYSATTGISQLAPFYFEIGIFSVLTLLGIGKTLLSFRSATDQQSLQQNLALFLMLILGLVSYLVQRGAYPYSLLPALAPSIVFCARLFPNRLRTGQIAFVGLLLLLFVPLSEDNREQRELLSNIEIKVPPDSCVYDNSGTAVTRDHVAFYFFTDALMRKLFQSSFSDELLNLIKEKDCRWMIKDFRYRELPPQFRKQLEEMFPVCTGSLCGTG